MLNRLRSDFRRVPSLFSARVLPVITLALIVFMHILPQGGLLIFAPDKAIAENPAVGAVTGYIANVLDSGDAAGAAIRTSMFPTLLWVFVSVPCAVAMLNADCASMSSEISRARGVAPWSMVLSRLIVCLAHCLFWYIVLSSVTYADAANRMGVTFTVPELFRFVMVLAVNMVLIAVAVVECALLYSVTRNTFITVVLYLVLFYVGTVGYYGVQQQLVSFAADAVAVAPVTWITPAPFLQHTCSLSFSSMSAGAIVIYAVVAIAASVIGSLAVTHVREEVAS